METKRKLPIKLGGFFMVSKKAYAVDKKNNELEYGKGSAKILQLFQHGNRHAIFLHFP